MSEPLKLIIKFLIHLWSDLWSLEFTCLNLISNISSHITDDSSNWLSPFHNLPYCNMLIQVS